MLAPKGPEWGEELAGPEEPHRGAVAQRVLLLSRRAPLSRADLFAIVASLVAVGPLIVWVLMVIDAYQLAERTQRIGGVRTMENGIDLLDQVFGPQGLIKA